MTTTATTTTTTCPCGSGVKYKACCGRYHAATSASERAPTAEALMRSRWSAFSLGLGEYLYTTLAASHPDRAATEDASGRSAVIRELGRTRQSQRFMKLTVIWSAEDEVLFHAKIFEKGQDRSFAELSHFVKEDGEWKYESGILVMPSKLPKDPAALAALDRDAFLALIS